MIKIRKEGERASYGFNFYPLSDPSSSGFIFKFWHDRSFWFRYSKNTKTWSIGFRHMNNVNAVLYEVK